MTWMQTYTGFRFELQHPDPRKIWISDIAESLSKLCRFNGHCLGFYSVAEHSVIVSRHVPPEHALWGLLHDAHEAYIGDIIKPLKDMLWPRTTLRREWFSTLEARYHTAIALRYGLTTDSPPSEVRNVDLRLLSDERDQVMFPMAASSVEWGNIGEPLGVQIACLSHEDAKAAFMERFLELA